MKVKSFLIFLFVLIAIVYSKINSRSNTLAEVIDISATEPENSDRITSSLYKIETLELKEATDDSKAQSKLSSESDKVLTPIPQESGKSFDDNNLIVAQKIDDTWLTQSDILLRTSDLEEINTDSGLAVARLSTPQLWNGGVIPYTVESNFVQSFINPAIREIHSKTNIRFRKRMNEKDFVEFKLTTKDVCQSYLGKKGGKQQIMIHPSCSKGHIVHELMHAIGFVHEHMREDRDMFIVINWDNIKEFQKNQFQMLPSEVSNPSNSEFDFRSIMMYHSFAFSKNESPTITKLDGEIFESNRSELSKQDVLKINQLYDF